MKKRRRALKKRRRALKKRRRALKKRRRALKSNMLMFDFKARCVSQTFHCVPEQPTNASPAGPATLRYHRNGILPYLPGKIRLSLFILDKTRQNRTYQKEPKRIRRKKQENRYKKSTQYTILPNEKNKAKQLFSSPFFKKGNQRFVC